MKQYLYILFLASNSLFCNFVSQWGQDRYLVEQVFKYKQNGVFVDVGAHDGKTSSNTYYLEKEFGWTGICLEPNPRLFESLTSNRPNSICLSCGIFDVDGQMDFTLISGYAEMLSGITKSYDPRHINRLNWEINNIGGDKENIKINVRKLSDVLKENNITHVDYLSIDTEGSEYNIIKSINFEEVFIDVISLENNYGIEDIQEYLYSKGFVHIGVTGDEFYRNTSPKN